MRRRLASASGLTILEAMVSMAISAALGTAAVGSLRTSLIEARDAGRELVSSLRVTRTLAMSRGDHYRLAAAGDRAYEIQRLELEAGVWQVDESPVQRVDLPAGLQFASTSWGAIEFDTRGTQSGSEGLVILTIEDAHGGRRHEIEVWPSGQVGER